MSLALSLCKRIAHRLGWEVMPLERTFGYKHRRLFSKWRVDLLLDVGAHVGDYAAGMRKRGFDGRIVSFEPRSEAFARLNARALADGAWTAVQCGVGDADTTAEIHVSASPMSSSLLPMRTENWEHAEQFKYLSAETIGVRRLDSCAPELFPDANRMFLKLDTQGYERRVIEGASRTLDRVVAMQLELSLVEMYDGETRMAEMIPWLEQRGFHLFSITDGYSQPGGRAFQVYALFERDPLQPPGRP